VTLGIRHTALLFALLAAVVLAPAEAATGDPEPGLIERLRYELFFGPLPVGEASLSAYEIPSPVGDLRHFVLKADSYLAVDMIFKVRDRAESVYDESGGRSLWYLKSFLEDGRMRALQTRFNWRNSLARRIVDGEVLGRAFLPPRTLDPLSAMYQVRENEIRGFGVKSQWITDGLSVGNSLFEFTEEDTVRVPYGTFRAYAVDINLVNVESPLHTGAENRFTVWVAPSKSNLPVKIVAPVDLGPFNGVLNALLVEVEPSPPE
jgi:hypothetical protein